MVGPSSDIYPCFSGDWLWYLEQNLSNFTIFLQLSSSITHKINTVNRINGHNPLVQTFHNTSLPLFQSVTSCRLFLSILSKSVKLDFPVQKVIILHWLENVIALLVFHVQQWKTPFWKAWEQHIQMATLFLQYTDILHTLLAKNKCVIFHAQTNFS